MRFNFLTITMEEIDCSWVMGLEYGVIKKFEGKNFILWKFKIESLFKARELWGLINGEEVKLYPSNALGFLVYERKDRWALNLFIQSLSNNQFMYIRKEIITKGVWKTFQKRHVDKGLVNKIFLRQKFFMSWMESIDTMEYYLNKLGTMVNNLDVWESYKRQKIKRDEIYCINKRTFNYICGY